ncbi:MAG: hypothetical protein NC041_08365 [Bacteroides sp.]|nr:hypothetical protein [Prevotella sp.]MCM1408302.1 hypothetical protein [Treponema brennaborense]MCM1470466.1 hypothetical protein [Bacteroides sp.]
MDKMRFEKLYEQTAEGLLSKEDTAHFIMEQLYTHPAFFGINTLTQDERSEYILHLYPLLLRITDIFNPESGTFLGYVQAIIRRNMKSWKKRQQEKSMKNEFCYQLHLENDFDQSIASETEASYFNHTAALKQQSAPALDKQMQKKHLDILILACKSSVYLTEQHIEKLSKLTSKSQKELWDIKNQLDNSVAGKLQKRQKKLESANISYMRRFNSKQALNNAGADPYLSEKYKNRFLFHDKMWKKQRKIASEYTITPSCSKIAEVLHTSTYKVQSAFMKLQNKHDFPIKDE